MHIRFRYVLHLSLTTKYITMRHEHVEKIKEARIYAGTTMY